MRFCLKYVGYTVVAGAIIGTTYLAWAELFVNKVLAAAEHLAKELNKNKIDEDKVKRLSMKFYDLLHEAIDDTETQEEAKVKLDENKEEGPIVNDTTEFGQEHYGSYAEREECRAAAIALIEEVFGKEEKLEEENSKEATKSDVKIRKIKVNRLRWVDRDKLEEALTELFQEEHEEGSKSNSNSSSTTTSTESN